jgi:hypothetical protein
MILDCHLGYTNTPKMQPLSVAASCAAAPVMPDPAIVRASRRITREKLGSYPNGLHQPYLQKHAIEPKVR